MITLLCVKHNLLNTDNFIIKKNNKLPRASAILPLSSLNWNVSGLYFPHNWHQVQVCYSCIAVWLVVMLPAYRLPWPKLVLWHLSGHG